MRAELDATHRQLAAALARLSDADLERPVATFAPDDQPANPAPLAAVIHENTWRHLEEHRGWIAALVASLS